jgi:hypothetical protein
MPHFIKTGYWDLLRKAPANYLDLELLITQSTASLTMPSDLYCVVSETGTIEINDGQTVIDLPSDFAGKRIRIFRNNLLLDYTNLGGFSDSYFTYDSILNQVTLSVAASSEEKFVITAY